MLYEIDAASGAATAVGDAAGFGMPLAGVRATPAGLASLDGSGLYMVGADKDWLYELNTSDGTAERVGSAEDFGSFGGRPRGHRRGLPQTRRVRCLSVYRRHRLHRRSGGRGRRVHAVRAGERRPGLPRRRRQQRCRTAPRR